jgi:thiamine biosynthesis lipoprotein
MRPLLGTFVEIGASRDRPGAAAAIAAAFHEIEQIQALLSFQDPDSELTRLNRSDGEWVALNPRSIRVLRRARVLGRASGGRFNCTVGGALVQQGILPDHGGPAPLFRGEPEDLEVSGHSARLRRPVRITLDGIAKGFAVDCAVATLIERGLDGGWVNAGGDLRAFGDAELPVQRREPEGGFRTLGRLRCAALATSVFPGTPDCRFTAWLVGAGSDPIWPGTWSVLAPQAWLADALTKVSALCEPARRSEMIARLGGRLLPAAIIQ